MKHKPKPRRHNKVVLKTLESKRRIKASEIVIEIKGDVDYESLAEALSNYCHDKDGVVIKTKHHYAHPAGTGKERFVKYRLADSKHHLKGEPQILTENYHRVLGSLFNREKGDIKNLLEVLKEKH